MLERAPTYLAFSAAIGSGLTAGVFFAFSTFVMAALARLPAMQGLAAMNEINVTVINPAFMAALMGTALACVILACGSLLWWGRVNGGLILAASVIYLVGCFAVTMAFNVPLNDKLAAVGPTESTALWARYLHDWTMWNHVRTAAPIASMALFIVALMRA